MHTRRVQWAGAFLIALALGTGAWLWSRSRNLPSRQTSGTPPLPESANSPGDGSVATDPRLPGAGSGPGLADSPPDRKPPPPFPAEALEVYAAAFQAARPGRLPPDRWRERLPNVMKWSGENRQWSCADFGVDWPSNILVLFGRFPETNVRESVRTSDLESWLATKRSEGAAITLEEGRKIAEEFLGRFVPDLAARNYVMRSSRWRSGGQKYGGLDSDSSVWFEYIFVQAPREDLGEVVVTEGRISISVDPLSSEVACFRRGFSRLEPRIAFTGPLLSEAEARRLWEDRMQRLVAPPAPGEKVVEGPLFELLVEVTWDEYDIPHGRPLWQVTFGTVFLTDPADPDKGVGLAGQMKIDARSGEVLLFRRG